MLVVGSQQKGMYICRQFTQSFKNSFHNLDCNRERLVLKLTCLIKLVRYTRTQSKLEQIACGTHIASCTTHYQKS